MRGQYVTLRMPGDTRPDTLSDEGYPDDTWPCGDEARIADDIARALVEVAALDAMIEETEEKNHAA